MTLGPLLQPSDLAAAHQVVRQMHQIDGDARSHQRVLDLGKQLG